MTATQPMSTISIGGDALVRLSSMAFAGGKGIPFVIAGGGYFRQTDDHQLELASGGYFEAGGGANTSCRSAPKDFRACWPSAGTAGSSCDRTRSTRPAQPRTRRGP